MTQRDWDLKYDHLLKRHKRYKNAPIPERCQPCAKDCGRWRYQDGGCLVYRDRPPDSGQDCCGFTTDPEWERKIERESPFLTDTEKSAEQRERRARRRAG